MFILWLLLALAAAAAGVFVGRLALRNYREIAHRLERITFALVAEDALQFAAAGALLFFAAYFAGISIMDRYTGWTAAEVLEAARLALFGGVVVLFTSLYQMFATRKYRQWMTRKDKE
jgi:hypothetical protein